MPKKSKKTRTKKPSTSTLPLSTDILSRYVLAPDEDSILGLKTILKDADAFAVTLIEERGTSGCGFADEVAHFVDKVLGAPYNEAAKAAHAALEDYFELAPAHVEKARGADEMLYDVRYEEGRAGFVLGFAVALRLQAAVAGGAR